MTKDPIAIIGMGCRFPGSASSPQKFWDLLNSQVDAVIDVPKNRWDLRRFYDPNVKCPGKMVAKQGGFLKEEWDKFDAEFFHFSPREAKFLDPQQRLLLELAWEAMEDGGLLPNSLKGTNGAVFIGAFTNDWQSLQNSPFNRHLCENYTGINSSKTILSARLSHFFDLKGPSLTVDTACSSSLVAVHLACQSIWQNESSFAIAGGVNAMLAPETSIALSKGRFLNPDAKCRSFDADGKGYVRGEGGGVVILKPLSLAIQDNDPIYALICGTGINQDGYTEGGITQPNAKAQTKLIEEVLKKSGICPTEVDYFEAHGTGTPAGDPVEALAIHLALSDGRKRSHPCYLGSVKSNIGHLEAASGIAGLIKAALCLKHQKIPPNIHFETPHPQIPFDRYCLTVPVKEEDFPKKLSSYVACVNSLGYGGTNAHAALKSYQKEKSVQMSSDSSFLFPLSAKNPFDLRQYALVLAQFLHENREAELADIAYTLAYKRTHFDTRAAIFANSTQELKQKLLLLGKDEKTDAYLHGKALLSTQLTFVYTGMGPQWWGMGRDLLKLSPLFFQTLQDCDAILKTVANWSLIEELQKSESNFRMDDPQVAQVANFSLQVALTYLLKSFHIQPDQVIGHSIGEVAAAVAAGALTLEEGLKISFHRSRLQSKRKSLGTMLAVGLSKDECESILKNYEGKISLAAINGSHSITLSGEKEALIKVAHFLENKQLYHRFLKVNIAYHSSQMEGLEEEMLASLSFLSPKKPQIPFFSTVEGDLYEESLNAHYWWKNVRNPVLFAPALNKIIAGKCQRFIEIGPHPVLGAYVKEALLNKQEQGVCIATLNRKKKENIAFQECLGNLFVSGYPVSWKALNSCSGNFLRLPTYQWNKQVHWMESEESLQYRLGKGVFAMLNRQIKVPLPTWQIEVNAHYFSWLHDHKIEGTTIFPAAAYVEAGFEIDAYYHEKESFCLEELIFHCPMAILESQEPLLQISLNLKTKEFLIHSLSDVSSMEWVLHASGKCLNTPFQKPKEFIDIEFLKMGNEIEGKVIYQKLSRLGLDYGEKFQGIKKLWKKKEDALSEIYHDQKENSYLLSPPLLDAAFQTLIGTFESEESALFIPHEIDQILFYRPLKEIVYCYALQKKRLTDAVWGDLVLCDETGEVCLKIKGLKLKKLTHPSEKSTLYQPSWVEKLLAEKSSPISSWAIGVDLKTLSTQIKASLQGSSFEFNPLTIQTQEKADALIQSFSSEATLNLLVGFVSKVPLSELASQETKAAMSCLFLAKAIGKQRKKEQTRLWIVTEGTHSPTKSSSCFGASLWGLMRVIRQEIPFLECMLIDIEEGIETSKLISELQQSKDDEVFLSKNHRFAYQIKKFDEMKGKKISLSARKQRFSLAVETPGVIDSLYYKEATIKAPLDDEVVIQVHSSSLNFKDLMKVLGMLGENALEGTYFGSSFGMECSGTILSVGKKVTKFRVGDHVCAFIPNAFQSHLTVKERYLHPIPFGSTLAQAAIYIPFMTVLYALKEVGKLRKGEILLIHSASGAVGLAAIQLAKKLGARIFATAGTEDKRAYVETLGVEKCFDSRSLSFAMEILEKTGGKGVDVLLNSLGGEALLKSWSIMAPYGRFLEIGKKDISSHCELPMKHFDRNTLFASIDLDRLFLERPYKIKHLLNTTSNLFKKGVFHPLPCLSFPAKECADAFQYMARSKHIGKIMLHFDEQTVHGVPLEKKFSIDSSLSYLITGGFGGFGLIAAKWLAEKGAKHLILLGRSKNLSQEAKDVLKFLKKKGVKVTSLFGDVSNLEVLKNLLKNLRGKIKGILHCAMVLSDGFLEQQTEETMRKAFAPKIAGTINLHLLTKDLPLDFFVLFSSIASQIGNPGQANYAAANAFLDSFCHLRRSLGLPATTINWGALDLGVLAKNRHIATHLANHGIQSIPSKEAVAILEKILQKDPAQIIAANMQWNDLMQSLPKLKDAFAFNDFHKVKDRTSTLRDEILAMKGDQQIEFLKDQTKKIVGGILKMDPSAIDPTIRLNKLGVDSLMSMELLAAIEKKLEVKVPTMELMRGPTLEQLAHLLLRLFLE